MAKQTPHFILTAPTIQPSLSSERGCYCLGLLLLIVCLASSSVWLQPALPPAQKLQCFVFFSTPLSIFMQDIFSLVQMFLPLMAFLCSGSFVNHPSSAALYLFIFSHMGVNFSFVFCNRIRTHPNPLLGFISLWFTCDCYAAERLRYVNQNDKNRNEDLNTKR